MANFRRHATYSVFPYALFFVLIWGLTFVWGADLPPLIPSHLKGIAAAFALAFIASLWPDVDTESKSQRFIYRGIFLVNLALILEGAYLTSAILGLLAMIPLLGKHRGWTHSRLTMVLLPSPLLWVPMFLSGSTRTLTGLPYYLAAMLGYATHLGLDGRLWPRRRKRR